MAKDETAIVINGWEVYAHPLFLEPVESLEQEFKRLRQKFPSTFQNKKAVKRLAAIAHLAFRVIPDDPTRSEYRQGNTLGKDYKNWFRAKLFQQYRLFFRYSQKDKIIVLAWINDDDTKRAYGSDTDAYRTFEKMLNSGNPPDDWDTLLAEAKAAAARFADIRQKLQD